MGAPTWRNLHARRSIHGDEKLISSPLGGMETYRERTGLMGRGLRGVLASAGAMAAVALFAPAAAVAHPCAGANAKASAGAGFLSVNSATWVGLRPVHVDHECDGEGGPVTSTLAKAAAAGVSIAADPTLAEVAAQFEHSPNMTPIGY